MTTDHIHESPGDLCASYAESGFRTKVTIRDLDNDYILIEAPAKGLRFLGELLLAQAEFSKDCGFQIDWGSKFFDRSFKKGIYIHRLPCLDEKRKGSSKTPKRGTPGSTAKAPKADGSPARKQSGRRAAS